MKSTLFNYAWRWFSVALPSLISIHCNRCSEHELEFTCLQWLIVIFRLPLAGDERKEKRTPKLTCFFINEQINLFIYYGHNLELSFSCAYKNWLNLQHLVRHLHICTCKCWCSPQSNQSTGSIHIFSYNICELWW